jgi:hypothetical protein
MLLLLHCNAIEGSLECRYLEFEVFTAVATKNAVFWDVAPRGFIINRRFGGTCRLHLQGRRNNYKN